MSDQTSRRLIKVTVISDFMCIFCYIANKTLYDAIDACSDLPLRFEVEFRPFSLMCLSSNTADANKSFSRKAYYAKKFGKEQCEAKCKVTADMVRKAGLTMAEDGVICRSVQAHRLSTKAYQVGGQAIQKPLISHIFDACYAKGQDISDEKFLVDAAVKVGLMNRERATEFLKSTESLDCVEKMVQAARANGVNGVPFIIIDGKWALNGVQSVECYVQIFRKLASSTSACSNPATLAKTCNSCKDPIFVPALSAQ